MRYLLVLSIIAALSFGAAQSAGPPNDQLTALENLLKRFQQDSALTDLTQADLSNADEHVQPKTKSVTNGLFTWRSVLLTLAFSVGGGVLSYWRRKVRGGLRR